MLCAISLYYSKRQMNKKRCCCICYKEISLLFSLMSLSTSFQGCTLLLNMFHVSTIHKWPLPEAHLLRAAPVFNDFEFWPGVVGGGGRALFPRIMTNWNFHSQCLNYFVHFTFSICHAQPQHFFEEKLFAQNVWLHSQISASEKFESVRLENYNNNSFFLALLFLAPVTWHILVDKNVKSSLFFPQFNLSHLCFFSWLSPVTWAWVSAVSSRRRRSVNSPRTFSTWPSSSRSLLCAALNS